MQRGTVDAVRLPINLFSTLKSYDVVKYVTQAQEAIFVSFGVVSKAWFDKLPSDLQEIVTQEGANLDKEMSDWSKLHLAKAAEAWRKNGGEVIRFAPAEQAAFLTKMSTVGDKVFAGQPKVLEMYKLLLVVANSNEQ